MAVIPGDITKMTESILSYVLVILTILLFVKIFQTLGATGIGGLFKKGPSTTRTTDPKDPKGTTGPGDKIPGWKEEFEEAKDHPGKISFQVRNLHDKNVKGAIMEMWTTKRTRWFFKSKGRFGRLYRDISNEDGIIPSNGEPWSVPSVAYRVQVTYQITKWEKYKKDKTFERDRNFISRLLRKNKIVVTTDIDIHPDENGVHSLTIPFNSEKDVHMEPQIISLKYDDAKGELETKGIIQH
jgi:hypothetical protein